MMRRDCATVARVIQYIAMATSSMASSMAMLDSGNGEKKRARAASTRRGIAQARFFSKSLNLSLITWHRIES